jgi:hypothetical protein
MSSERPSPDRPEFMVLLGLSPPYAVEDIKKAYLDQVVQVHPDHGGSLAEFRELQEAFEQATRHLEFRCDRREWIAEHIDSYVAMQELVKCLDRHGAQVTTNAIDWLEQSFGEFTQLTETILAVRLANSQNGDDVIQAITKEPSVIKGMIRLELPGCQISDESVLRLCLLKNLQYLDLSRTPITKNSLAIIEQMPELISLNLQGTRIGWWQRRKARALLNKRPLASPLPTTAGKPSARATGQ